MKLNENAGQCLEKKKVECVNSLAARKPEDRADTVTFWKVRNERAGQNH